MTHELTLGDDTTAILAKLDSANTRFTARYPGESEARQPVHTVYGGAQLFRADIAARLGKGALASMKAYAPDPFTFARALGAPGAETLPTKKKESRAAIAAVRKNASKARVRDHASWLAVTVYDRVLEKLAREPVEDFRIDFEDGFGHRSDEEEDATAIRTAEEVAKGMAAGTLPPFLGIRIKPFSDGLERRSARTLDLFFTTLVKATDGRIPERFVVTLPKVPVPEQVTALDEILTLLEQKLGLKEKEIRVELMIELTQSIFDAGGRFNLPLLLEAANGRCVGAHFGTYDYTASNSITAAHQRMDHPWCELALGMMKIAYAGTGVHLSDGATNVLPVPLHRAAEGKTLNKRERQANAEAIHAAWALAYRHVRGSLTRGYYQGWDLHPAQLPVRYAATYGFFLEGFAPAAERLSNFISKAAQATLVGDVFDDAATGQGLLNFFLRALNAGAVDLEELGATGLTKDELATRSFKKILEGRGAAA